MSDDEDLLQELRARLAASPFHTWAGMEVVERRSRGGRGRDGRWRNAT